MTSTSLLQTAYEHHRHGRLAEAERAYLQYVGCQPAHAAAQHLLGLLYLQTNRPAQALKHILEAVRLEPDNPDYLNNCGAALRANGRAEEAVRHYLRALQLNPQDPELRFNLGNAYLELQRFEEAAQCYRQVLQAMPGNADVRASLCQALHAHGFHCHAQGLYAQAEVAYLEAVQLAPSSGTYHYNLGNAQRELGKAEAALQSYQRARQLMPDDADVHNNLGNVLRETGQLEAAIDAYRQALQLNPKLYHARVHLVHQKQHACDWDGLEQDISIIRQWVESVPEAQISPFAFLSMPDTTAQEQKRCADNWVGNRLAGLFQSAGRNEFNADPKHEKLRIGYLSSDFRLHPLAFLVSELIECHDRERFEIHAYSNAVDDGTPERRRLEQAFDHFTDIRLMSDAQVAERIRQDQINILVDLTGFTQASRTALVALRPAQISIAWLGFPGTMGSYQGQALFDYILTDAYITPEGTEADFAETPLRLPVCYQPNDRKRPVGASTTRAENGLPDDVFVFCCFNQSFKITEQIFDLWMDILRETPSSVLWLLECNSIANRNLQRAAEARGVSAQRLIFAPRVPIADHLARHRLADLFLDTLPYNAHTTASDALWMGLPLLTCSGTTFAGRVAGSLLHALGMHELICHDLEEYRSKALQLATDRERLAAIRQRLEHGRAQSPLFDTERFARDLEQRYHEVWQSFLRRQTQT
ncbi:MAG TPA: tetratricopeptide repeat protein [Methylophilaceae bacterium]